MALVSRCFRWMGAILSGPRALDAFEFLIACLVWVLVMEIWLEGSFWMFLITLLFWHCVF